jgi:sporulation protein YlmC with PRC-barrel domain
VRPTELRAELSRLTGLLGFQVLDGEGAVLGSVADFVINTCETYIIYFLLDPAEGLGVPAGSRPAAPFEAVTINSGVLDAQMEAILLPLAAGHFAHAPALPEGQELVPVDWEAEVREYWSQYLRLSNLTTGCRVSAPGGSTEIHKVAYASELLGTELRDGLQNLLGSVEEMILEPESGKGSFFVVRLQEDQSLVLVPLRVVNIPKEALGPGSQVSLVLLTENALLLNAPRVQSLEEAAQMSAQGTARSYWGR